MNKLSIKLATVFFLVVLILQSILMIYLHEQIMGTKIQEEVNRLQEVGERHRAVLEDQYSTSTMEHIVLMEEGTEHEVIILSATGQILHATNMPEDILTKYKVYNSKETKDQIRMDDWQHEAFIVGVFPFHAEENGVLIMLQSTESLIYMEHELNKHFLIAGITSFISLLLIYSLLSRKLTRPLIKMKEATEKLSKGQFTVEMPKQTNDELGKLSSAIQSLATDLAHLKNERGEFLASVGHELSTPLTYLIGYIQILMREGLSNEERKKYLLIVQEESQRMKYLIRNLLDLARLDENQFVVEKTVFAVVPFIDQVQQLVQSTFSDKQIHLVIECEEKLQLHADPMRTQQILLNLLDNAQKYSEPNTTVKLKVSQASNQIVFHLVDQGEGIPQADLPYIFERLYRVEKSRSRLYGGSGLGLAIVKQLVEAQEGTITVQSELGVGTEFTITLPGGYFNA